MEGLDKQIHKHDGRRGPEEINKLITDGCPPFVLFTKSLFVNLHLPSNGPTVGGLLGLRLDSVS